ncbi:NAD(P)-dependent oxidoreductase [Rhodococcus jostii]|uniref:NAD(P)-dependent oxidoreductase n=1 Tax=Rhodococcus jostii TaxID=132919 RepID=UPI003629A859
MSDVSRNIAVLGTGTMGAPIARNLMRAGYRVRVWNRTTAKAAELAAEGAHLASSPAAASAGADVVITMLSDGAAVEEVMTGPAGALSTLSSDAVWIQMSTVGVESCTRLVDLAGRNGVVFVDAPVSGSTAPAAAGELVVLAAGARPVRSRVEPIFEVLGRRTLWLERAGDGSRLKLALNNWLAVLVEGMAETLTLSDALGIDPEWFLDAVTGGPMASDYAMSKGAAMLGADFTPGFPLRLAVKDAELVSYAAHQLGVELALTKALLPRWHDAVAGGHGDDDVSSAVTAPATTTSAARRAMTAGA